MDSLHRRTLLLVTFDDLKIHALLTVVSSAIDETSGSPLVVNVLGSDLRIIEIQGTKRSRAHNK